MCRRMLKVAIPHAKSEVADHLTVSIGVAAVSSNSNVQSADIVVAADHLLYEAKQAGRNQVRAGPFTPDS